MTRLFRFASADEVDTTLVHGVQGHPFVPEFGSQARCGSVSFGSSLRSRLLFLSSGKRWMRRNAPAFDVAFAISSMYSTLALADAARRASTPSVSRIENSTKGLPARGWYSRIRDIDVARYAFLRRSNAVIAMSSQVENELLEAGIEQSRVVRIPQHCDTRLFVPRTAHERSEWRGHLGWPDRFTFVCVGEVVPRKRQLMLVEAVARLAREGYDVQLALVGPIHDVAYGREIRDAGDALGIRDRLILSGFNRQVQFFYFASDAFLLPSVNENMPNSLVESLSCGLPVVVSDFAGAADCVDSGSSGWVVPLGGDERLEWEQRMKSIIAGGCSAFGPRARAFAESQLDSRIIWPRYLAVLRSAAEEGAR